MRQTERKEGNKTEVGKKKKITIELKKTTKKRKALA